MSDFLSALRGIGQRVVEGSESNQARRARDAAVRQSDEYRRVARSFTGVDGPATMRNFRLQDSYSREADEAYGRAANLFAGDTNPSKDIIQQGRDTALEVGGGLIGGAMDVAALAGSSFATYHRSLGNNVYDVGVPIAEASGNTREFISGLRTQEAENSSAARAVTGDVISRNNRQIEQEALAAGTHPLIAGAERLGSDFVDHGADILRQPEELASGVSQGIGSLLLGGPLAKGATAGARFVAPGIEALSARGLLSAGAARAVVESVEKGAMTGSIAAMEAGGAYSDAANRVMAMTPEELALNSPMYTELRKTMSHERAQSTIASRAGTIAATLQAPVAAATGTLVSKFEAAPLAATSLKGSLQNVGRETIEEGVQSFSGAASTNAGLRLTANENQDLLEGLGQGVAEGSLFGAGTAGALSSAGAAVNAPASVGQAVSGTLRATQARGRAANQKDKYDQAAAASAAVKEAAAPYAPQVMPDVDQDVDMREMQENADVLESLNEQFRFNPAEFEPQNEAEAVLKAVMPQENSDIFTAMEAAVAQLDRDDLTPEQRIDTALFIADLQGRVTGENLGQVLQLQAKAAVGGNLANAAAKIIGAQEKVENHKGFNEAIQSVFASLPEVTVDDIQDISTPEGQRAAKQVATQVQLTPENISPEVVERLLKHTENTPEAFTKAQAIALRSTAALNQTLKAATEAAKVMGVEAPNSSRVANEIQIKDANDPGATGPSVLGHTELVTSALRRGDLEGARAALNEYRNFAQHMANKLGAVNTSFTSRQPNTGYNPEVPYQAWSYDDKKWYAPKKGWAVARFNTASIADSQQIGVDAEYVINNYNTLAAQNPALGLEPVEQVRLDDGLRMPARKVFEEAKKADFAEKNPDIVKPAKQADTKPAETQPQPVQEPAKETAKPEPVEEPAKEEAPEDRLYTADQVRRADSLRPIQNKIDEIENRILFDTERKNDRANLEVLRAERDRREDALREEESVVVEDTAAPTPEATEEVAEPEAQPEVTATEEVAPKPLPTVEELFPDVVKDADGSNLLLDGFTTDENSRSRLIGEDAISLEDVVKTVTTETSGVTEPVTKAYASVIGAVLNKVLPTMDKRLSLSKNYRNVSVLSKAGVNKFVSMRLLNFMVQWNGKLAYNQTIQQVGALALADWLAQNSVANPTTDAEDIRKALGMKPGEAVSSELEAAFNGGMALTASRRGLAVTLGKFLGLKAKGSVRMGFTKALLESMAIELLDSAEESGLITRTTIGEQDEQKNFLSVNTKVLGLNNEVSFGAMPSLISETVLNDTSVRGYSFEKPADTANKVQKNTSTATTQAERETELREASVPQTVNEDFVAVLRGLDKAGIVALLGEGALDENVMNVNDYRSKQSKNRSFEAAYDVVMGLVDAMGAVALERNVDLSEVQLFRDYIFSSVNRLQQRGLYGDQSSKLTREAITAMAVTLDLTDPADLLMWKRSVAQAFGMKVDKESETRWLAALDKYQGTDEFKAALEAMKAEKKPENYVQILKDAGIDSTVKLHALMSQAQFDNAEDKSNFFTHMYVEADGVTDGPTNSLLYMRIGGFDADMVRGLARGGVVFAEEAKSVADLFDPAEGTEPFGGEVLKDTYVNAADLLKNNLGSKIREAIQSAASGQAQNMSAQATAAITVLDTLMGKDDFSYAMEDGKVTFTIGRKMLKNPLTISLYGSSANGIAMNVAEELVKGLYARMSEAHALSLELSGNSAGWQRAMFINEIDNAQGDAAFLAEQQKKMASFWSALSRLNDFGVRKDFGKWEVFEGGKKLPALNAVDPVKFTVSPAGLNNIASALRVFYIDPMVTTIEQVMGSSMEGSDLIQKTSNMMSSLAQAAAKKAVYDSMEEHVRNGGSWSDGVSPDALKKAFQKIAFLLPYMAGDLVNVNIKGLEPSQFVSMNPTTGDKRNIKASANVYDTVSHSMEIDLPGLAGVGGAAKVNISYGDGRMIIAASPLMKGGRGMVFDGINTNLRDAQANGKAINQAVLDVMTSGTPFQDLLKTYKVAAETLDVTAFGKAELTEIFFNNNSPFAKMEGEPAALIQGQMMSLLVRMESAALDEQARQAVFARVHLSSDHMAAINAPASTKGQEGREDLSGMTYDEMGARLQEMFLEERAKVETNAKAAVTSDKIEAAFEGLPDHKSGAKVVSTDQLTSLLSGMNMPKQQEQLIRRAVSALSGSWNVVIGNLETANAYAKAKGIAHVFKAGDFGLAAPARRTVIVANGSSETLAHELIHAATFERVEAYMIDPMQVDPASRNAIARLEALQEEWLDVIEDYSALRKKSIAETVTKAKSAIEQHLKNNDKAAALNEFMAWNLANENLTELNSGIVVENKLVRIAKDVLRALRAMFGLPPRGPDMNSNIRFNTMLLMSRKLPTPSSVAASRLLMHSTNTRPDLDQIMTKMASVLRRADKGYEKWMGRKPSQMALRTSITLAETVMQNGFNLTNEERRAFIVMVSAFRVNMLKDPAFSMKMNRYHRELSAQMNQDNMAIGDPQDPGVNIDARKRIALLDGTIEVGSDINGSSLVVPMFAALAAVNPEARDLFNSVVVRSNKNKTVPTSFDESVTKLTNEAMNALLDKTLGMKPGEPIGNEVHELVAQLVESIDQEKNFLQEGLELPGKFVNTLNDKTSDFISYGLGKVSDALGYSISKTQGTKAGVAVAGVAVPLQLGTKLLDKNNYEEAIEKITEWADTAELHPEVRGFITAIMGSNETNQDIFVLIKQGRAIIDRVRETFRKGVPQQMAAKFTRTLTKDEWSHVHVMGQMDLASLMAGRMTDGDVVRLLADPAAMKAEEAQKAADIQRLFGANAPAILGDASDLASLLVNKKPAHGFVKKNALAIANRVGEQTVGTFDNASPEVQAIDAYVSLLAMSQVAPSVLKSLSQLAKTEQAGLRYTLSMIAEGRDLEMKRVPDKHKYNVPKGYMPTETLGTFKAVPMDKLNDYTSTGYRLIGSRKQGNAEALYDARAKDVMYVATDLAAPSVKQGIMRIIRPSVFGIDAVSGQSIDKPTAGLITETVAVQNLTNALRKRKGNDNMISPIFNEDGAVVAYERLIDPSVVSNALETQENAAIAIGQWMGRQHEETQATKINEVLIDRLANMYNRAKSTAQTSSFVDLFELAKTDPVTADMLSLMPDAEISRIKARMDGKFMVRRTLVDNTIGFRSMSIGDLWTGNSRMQEENREALADFITGLLGPEAYRYLMMAEKSWTQLMGDARVGIVVKSMLVPVLNASANFYQLMANGIGPVQIATKGAELLRETHLYAKNEAEYQRLRVELAGARGAKRADIARRIETEMRKIEDLNRQLSIWPLIEAGEFSQISEGLTSEDMELSRGRFYDPAVKWADKLPPAVKTAGRYALITKDTALFAGLARSVAYTDFVAKAILYDHLTTKQKNDKKTALLKITNEFVNYDILDSRGMTKAEEMGLLWFWKFKVRSIKVAASLIRHNPLHTLLSSMVPGSYEAGTVMDDNGLNLLLDGRLPNSVGFDNAWRAVDLNPIKQIIG